MPSWVKSVYAVPSNGALMWFDFLCPVEDVNVKGYISTQPWDRVVSVCRIWKNVRYFGIATSFAQDNYTSPLHCRESMHITDHGEQYTMVLQNLNDESIVITRPDKGKGIVILNKTDYYTKIFYFLSDSSKLKLRNADVTSHLHKREDKLNKILRTLKETINFNA